MSTYNPYAGLPQQYQPQPQQQTQTIKPQEPLQQRPMLTDDIQKVALKTQEGKDALKEWLNDRDNLLTILVAQFPEGLKAYQKYEDKIFLAYNNIILETVNNNKNSSELDNMKCKSK